MRFLALALPLQPFREPLPVRLDGRRLRFEPALVIAQIFLGRGKDLAGTGDGRFDHGDGGLEGGSGLPVGVPIGGQERFGLAMSLRLLSPARGEPQNTPRRGAHATG